MLLYQSADVDPATEALRGSGFSIVHCKDKRSSDKYSAYHLIVSDWCAEDDEDCKAIRHLPCEIQICTIVEHVWNELEHDIKYKQPGGRPDSGQEELLRSLRAELDLCARTAQRLMSRTADRTRENDEAMDGASDLRRYLEGRRGSRVDGPFEEMWDFLNRLVARITPRGMDELFTQGQREPDAAILRDALDVDLAHREVGLVAVMLLPAFPAQDVREVIGPDSPRPLWRFMLRVLSRQERGTK